MFVGSMAESLAKYIDYKKSSHITGFMTALNYLDLIRNVPLFDSNFGRYVRDLGEAYKEFCVDVAMYQVS